MEVDKLKKLDEYEDIRKDIGFHFTSQSNVESILKTGLNPQIGDNSSGGLGKEAIEKTFFSYGLDGVLRLYNRLLNLSLESELANLRNSITHIPFIPESSNLKSNEEFLSCVEGFEFVRQYMEDNVYFMFDVPETKYANQDNLKEEDIKDINLHLKSIKMPDGEKTIYEQIKELDKEIEDLIKQNVGDPSKELIQKVEQRNNLSIEIRNQTLEILNQKRGDIINEQEKPIMEQYEYHEHKMRWYDQFKAPQNAHTRIVEENDGKLHGVRIVPDIMKLYSKDGESVSNGLDFLKDMYSRVKLSDSVRINEDCILLDKFIKYVDMVKKYEEQGKLKYEPEKTFVMKDKINTVPERYVMDLTDYSKYPGLEEFENEIKEYYQVASPKVRRSSNKNFNTGEVIDINELEKDSKLDAFNEWSEGNKGLEYVLYLCDKSNIKTAACCGGHPKEEIYSGSGAYLLIYLNEGNSDMLIKLLSSIEDIENCQIEFHHFSGFDRTCCIRDKKSFFKDEELFYNIGEKLDLIIQNPDIVPEDATYQKYKDFVSFFSIVDIRNLSLELNVGPTAEVEMDNEYRKLELLQNRNNQLVKVSDNEEADKFVDNCDFEGIELRALYCENVTQVAINLTREKDKIARLLSQIEDKEDCNIGFIKTYDGDSFCFINSKNNILKTLNQELEIADKNPEQVNDSYEKYKTYINFFSSKVISNKDFSVVVNKPQPQKTSTYHKDEIIKNHLLIDDELQKEVENETNKAIEKVNNKEQQQEK